jgi:hypothetical protein
VTPRRRSLQTVACGRNVGGGKDGEAPVINRCVATTSYLWDSKEVNAEAEEVTSLEAATRQPMKMQQTES